MIAILCPTRGRPEQFRRMIDSVHNTTAFFKPFIFYAVSPEELSLYQACVGKSAIITPIVMPDNLPTAQKWNYLCQAAKDDSGTHFFTHFMLGADDMVFETPGWDKALIDHYNALENKIHVYALRDSRDPDGTPHVIVSREYIEAMGYFVNPIFLHWFVDSWTVAIGRSNGVFTHLKDYLLAHIKPSDEGRPDETHSRIREWGWHERDKWVAEKMAHVLEGEKGRLGSSIYR